MSLFDTVKSWLNRPAQAGPLRHLPGHGGVVLDALRKVHDPELGVDIVSLGLVRTVEVEGERAYVGMVLTTPGCPVVGLMVQRIEEAVAAIGLLAEVEVLREPAWSPEDMSPEAREALG